MDYLFIEKFSPVFANCAWITIKLACLGILFSFLIGILCVLVSYFKLKLINTICRIYIEFSRNTPLIIQLFFLYFAFPKIGIYMDSFTCAVVGLSFLGGSYIAESLRAGIEAVKKQQFEAGLSLGLSPLQNFRFIILPQALSIAMPSISANIIFLFKETSVVSIVALSDLVYLMTDLNSKYYKTDELLFMLFMSYLIILLPLSLFLSFVEKRFTDA
ncbi:amino acid ABC transporter permease [Campylobacter sp. US33a]|uniref:Amino acid ABC transporter permease n=1 Tax=Campylobacter sp. CCS1377 TaxID=3158229 RepID=A0AAU7E9Z2_9BACT|nr:amino acid ABC transporter permease [Campylobacter sp. US33a]MCW1360095.1 amino acid ABC transporter permease [Campylobacter jejuni]TEY02399.1 amino acid ABC transporter permease [Campylobacter sp. US33a]